MAGPLPRPNTVVRPFPTKIPDYALVDCMKGCQKCNFAITKTLQGLSMANLSRLQLDHRRILQQLRRHYRNMDKKIYTLIHEILEAQFANRPGFVKPDPDAIVIHLRFGDDGVEYSRQTTPTLLTEGGVGNHPRPRKSKIKPFKASSTLLFGPRSHTVVMVGRSRHDGSSFCS